AALGVRRRWVFASLAAMLLGYGAVAALDLRFVRYGGPSATRFGAAEGEPVEFQLAVALFYGYAAAGAVVVGLTVDRLLDAPGPLDRATLFLVLWLLLEVVGYHLLTPFPGVRRVLGVGLVLALLVGRLAARRADVLAKRHLVG